MTGPDSPLDRSPFYLLHRARQCADELFQREMADFDLTPRQLAILLAVSKSEGLRQSELAERTGIDRSTVVDLVRRLLKKGLLRRRRNKKDTRAYAVRLTDRGRLTLEAALPVADRVDATILATVGPRRAKRFLGNLAMIVAKFGPPQAR